MAQRYPGQFAFVHPGADPRREAQAFIAKGLHDGSGRAGAGEGGEEMRDGVLHSGVGVEDDFAGGVIDQADGSSMGNSPRRALESCPPRRRARMKCSSASDIVPFRPSSSRSLKSAGS